MALRSFAGLALSVALAACGGSTGVVPGGERDDEAPERAVSAEARLFAVRVTERRWAVPPQRVLLHHTPLFVSIRSLADEALRLEPKAWSLVDEEGEVTRALAPERVVSTGSGSLAETRLIRGLGIRARVLQPGDSAQGFVFFRKRFAGSEEGRPVILRIAFPDADGTGTVDAIELPLHVGR